MSDAPQPAGGSATHELVSIVVRTKDRVELLAEALESLAAQSWLRLEAVVVNDGGADVSEVLARFSGRLDITPVDLQPGQGRSPAANAGIAAARGGLIGFLDDDDVWLPGGVAELAESARHEPGAVHYGRVHAYFYEPGDRDPARRRRFRTFGRKFDRDALLFENFIPIIGCLIPAALLRRVGGLDEALECYEDWDLVLRLGEVAPLRFVDAEVAEYRVFGGAFITGAGGQERQHVGRAAVYAKHWDRVSPEVLSRMQLFVKSRLLPEELEHETAAWRQRVADLENAAANYEEGLQFERDRVTALEERAAELESALAVARRRLRLRALLNVSVVVVNYNGRHHLERCLPALMETRDVDVEVIVVDNASSDGSVEWLEREWPGVKVLALQENLGFGEANRHGAEAASAPYVALLNSDTEVEPDWLWPLLVPLVTDPEVGATCSTLRLLHHPEVLNGRGGGMTKCGFGFDRDFGQPFEPGDGSGRTREVLFPTAAAMLMRRCDLLGEAGLDRRMFMYHEDVDLGWRLWLAGRRVLVCDDSVVRHVWGGTSHGTRGLLWRERMGARHNVRAILKNYQLVNVLRALRGLVRLWHSQRAYRHMLHVAWWNLRFLPGTLRQRRRIQRSRRISDAELFRRGLLSRAPYPPPHPDLPGAAPERDAGRWLESPVLLPGQYSALGRLGFGWYPPEIVAGERARLTGGRARCHLKVAARAKGVLTVRFHAPEQVARGGAVEVRCNGSSASTIPDDEHWQEVRMEVVADDRGLLTVDVAGLKWTPHLEFGNWDFRRLGCAVQSVSFTPSEPSQRRLDGVSVVVPTFNRCEALLRTLDALAGQSIRGFEVVVVDDGSSDGTAAAVREAAERWRDAFRLEVLEQTNQGPGAARNRGVAAAHGDLVVFLGDDTAPTPGLLEEHLRRHRELAGPAAVVGFTDWDREQMQVTAGLEMVNEEGQQFGYAFMEDRGDVPYTCFYTSNLSLPREALRAEPFDEEFPLASWEDVELGYRLSLLGLRIVYHRAATVHHFHPYDFAGFFRRQVQVGRTARVLLLRHPALADDPCLLPPRPSRWQPLTSRLVPPLVPLLSWLDRHGVGIPRGILRRTLLVAYFMGKREAELAAAAATQPARATSGVQVEPGAPGLDER